jgi:hypothetical protein
VDTGLPGFCQVLTRWFHQTHCAFKLILLENTEKGDQVAAENFRTGSRF